MRENESKGLRGLAAVRELAFTHWQRSRLLLAIQSLLVVLSLLIGAVLAGVFLSGWRTVARQQTIRRGTMLCRVLAEAALPRIEQQDVPALQALLGSADLEHSLLSAAIFDRAGNVVAATGRADGAQDSALSASEAGVNGACFFTRSPQTNQELVVFLYPIDSPSRNEGQVRLVMAAPGWLPFAGTNARSATVGISIIGTLLFMGTYAASRALRPVHALAQQLGEVKTAEGWRPILADSAGEVGTIAQSWNDMLASFERLRDDLMDSNRQLQLRSSVVQYQKRRIEQVLDHLPDGLIVIDADRKVSNCNHQAEALLQVQAEKTLGRTAADALPMLADLLRGSEHMTPSVRRSAELTVQQGETPLVLRAIAGPLPEAGGQRPSTLVVLRDITQAKAEEQARNDFVATVTHELRAPLTNIRSYVELLTDDQEGSAELRKEFFNVVNSESERLTSLINNLLNISRIEMGGYVLRRSPIKTQKLLEQVIGSVESQAQTKDIHLEMRLPDKLSDLVVDKDMIQVVLMNLLSNGLKYTGEGGTVVLSVEEQDGELLIHVTDTGCGIPEEDLPKLFRKFYRGSNAAMSATGSGLGLALSRQIARLHGGDLRIHSRLGQGTRVTLALPKRSQETLADVQA